MSFNLNGLLCFKKIQNLITIEINGSPIGIVYTRGSLKVLLQPSSRRTSSTKQKTQTGFQPTRKKYCQSESINRIF